MVDCLPRIELDPVIEFYKKDVDRTLIRENLKLTVEQRFLKLFELQGFAEELRRTGKEAKSKHERADSHLSLVDKSMFEELLRQMRNLTRLGKLHVTPHAFAEMQNDNLFIFDVEQCILTGQIVEQQRDLLLEQWKYVIHGVSSDGEPMAVVAKLDGKNRVFILTTYLL